tara:strand:+ start:599 stop:775 length:177 start_codon:yes stop_codon:yes gene_type:complete
MLAAAAGCSVPTMRRWLGENYGDRMTFRRGRTGGITLAAPATTEANTSENLVEDSIAS